MITLLWKCRRCECLFSQDVGGDDAAAELDIRIGMPAKSWRISKHECDRPGLLGFGVTDLVGAMPAQESP